MVEWIEKYLARRLEEHNQEIYKLEKRLIEYRGLNKERDIKREEMYYRFFKRLRLVGFEHWGYSEPPPMRPVLPRKPLLFIRGEIIELDKVVFPDVIADWDFNVSAYYLDSEVYVSPPSSLRVAFKSGEWSPILCKASETLNIPQGMIITYFRVATTDMQVGVSFRNQAQVGTANVGNTYLAWLYPYTKRIALFRFEGGAKKYEMLKTPLLEIWKAYTWYLERFTWWSDVGGGGVFVRVERMVDSEWQKECEDLTDPADKWKDSEINRVGFAGSYATGTNACWFDDTEIWSV
ncbi:MAG: hypothetical protein DRH17_13140 [Deltaproteobacteria bacterium]|nr:MAG: hypothetical protein DRH17_13140 [Deltaproteobacteria bacterium]